MNKENQITIFIVEDNDVYAKSLQAFINSRFPNIKEIEIFRLGELCLAELHRNPNIIIMDYFLNSKFEEAHNGLEIIKRIKAQNLYSKIILLSAQEKINVALAAIEHYNCSYVQKDQKAFNNVAQIIEKIYNHKNPPPFER
jgi:two-component system OmpR family response regulator